MVRFGGDRVHGVHSAAARQTLRTAQTVQLGVRPGALGILYHELCNDFYRSVFHDNFQGLPSWFHTVCILCAVHRVHRYDTRRRDVGDQKGDKN